MKVKVSHRGGFTIIELLVVIVIIGLLSSLVVIAYGGVRQRSVSAAQQADLSNLKKAIMAARINTDKTLGEITGAYWSAEPCLYIWDGGNTTNTVPRLLPKDGLCWMSYYGMINAIQAASGMNIENLKKGDPNGNPYYIDESEGEPRFGACGQRDTVALFSNTNADLDFDSWHDIPFYSVVCNY